MFLDGQENLPECLTPLHGLNPGPNKEEASQASASASLYSLTVYPL